MKKQLISATCIFLMSGACTSMGATKVHKTYLEALELSQQAQDLAAGYTTTGWRGEVKISEPDAAVMFAALTDKNSMQQAMAKAMILRSDIACEEYMGGAVATSNTVTSTLDVGAFGLTEAAKIVTPEASQEIILTLSSLAQGTEPILKKRLLGDFESDLIYENVMTARTRERSRLLTLLESTDSNQQNIIADIGNYHSMCGITVGKNQLRAASAAKSSSAEADGKKDAKNK